MRILDKRRGALAAALATAAVAIGAPVATASVATTQGGLPPSVTCPPWYGIYSIAGLGCLSWWQVWLMESPTPFAFRADHVTP